MALQIFFCFAAAFHLVHSQNTSAYTFTSSSTSLASNGFFDWVDATWPPSSVGTTLTPQTASQATLTLLQQSDPNKIEMIIQTLANFGTRHTASQANSTTRGIGAARQWLLSQITALASPSNGAMKVSMPCYLQEASPAHGMPIAAEVCNVQVEIEGSVDAIRTYVYTGHYDSRRLNNSYYIDGAPGVDDNASAVSIALEMIRILAPVVAETPPKASIIIAAVAGEEQGLFGSNFLAQTLKNASRNVQAKFNDDIVGSGSNFPSEIITRRYQDDTPSRHLSRYIQEVNAGASNVTEMDVALIYKPDRFFRGGDHESFLNAGFPAVRFTEPQEDFYHQHQDPRVQDNIRYGDEIEYVDFEYTARVGKINLLSLWDIANAPGTPTNFTSDTNIGFLADSLDTPPEYLENTIKLYWYVDDDPLLDRYEVVWRPMASQQWTHLLDVRLANTTTISVSKNNAVFGLRAVGKDGRKSPATYALAVASQYFG